MPVILRANSLAPKSCVATIGNFDGVHIGHKALVTRVKQLATELSLPTLVIMFEPSPKEYFLQDKAPARLMTFQEKFYCLKQMAVDYILLLRFNSKLAKTSASSFIKKILFEQLNTTYLVVGDDFSFGKDAVGNYQLLKDNAIRYNYKIEKKQAVIVNDKRVSSTLVRKALANNSLELIDLYLGRKFFFFGTVVSGQQIGRKLQFPTLNLLVKRKNLPIKGVYAVSVELFEAKSEKPKYILNGACNIGIKPTVDGTKPSVEVHCLGWKYDWWQPKKMKVSILKQLRTEKKFSGLDELRKQIAIDIEHCKRVLNFNEKVVADDRL